MKKLLTLFTAIPLGLSAGSSNNLDQSLINLIDRESNILEVKETYEYNGVSYESVDALYTNLLSQDKIEKRTILSDKSKSYLDHSTGRLDPNKMIEYDETEELVRVYRTAYGDATTSHEIALSTMLRSYEAVYSYDSGGSWFNTVDEAREKSNNFNPEKNVYAQLKGQYYRMDNQDDFNIFKSNLDHGKLVTVDGEEHIWKGSGGNATATDAEFESKLAGASYTLEKSIETTDISYELVDRDNLEVTMTPNGMFEAFNKFSDDSRTPNDGVEMTISFSGIKNLAEKQNFQDLIDELVENTSNTFNEYFKEQDSEYEQGNCNTIFHRGVGKYKTINKTNLLKAIKNKKDNYYSDLVIDKIYSTKKDKKPTIMEDNFKFGLSTGDICWKKQEFTSRFSKLPIKSSKGQDIDDIGKYKYKINFDTISNWGNDWYSNFEPLLGKISKAEVRKKIEDSCTHEEEEEGLEINLNDALDAIKEEINKIEFHNSNNKINIQSINDLYENRYGLWKRLSDISNNLANDSDIFDNNMPGFENNFTDIDKKNEWFIYDIKGGISHGFTSLLNPSFEQINNGGIHLFAKSSDAIDEYSDKAGIIQSGYMAYDIWNNKSLSLKSASDAIDRLFNSMILTSIFVPKSYADSIKRDTAYNSLLISRPSSAYVIILDEQELWYDDFDSAFISWSKKYHFESTIITTIKTIYVFIYNGIKYYFTNHAEKMKIVREIKEI